MSGSGAGLSGRVVGAEIRRAAKRVLTYRYRVGSSEYSTGYTSEFPGVHEMVRRIHKSLHN